MGAIFNPPVKMSDATQAGLYYARKRRRTAAVITPGAAWSLITDDFDFTNSTVADSIGGFTGTLSGITSGDVSDSALTLSGGGYITAAVPFPTIGALGFWVNPTAYNDWQSPAGWKNIAENSYVLIDNGGSGSPGTWRFVFNVGGNGEVDIVGPTIVESQWQYLLAMWAQYAPGQWCNSFFLNNQLLGTALYSGTITNSPGDFAIGTAGDAADNNFTGQLASLNLWLGNQPGASIRADLSAVQP